MWRFGLFGFWIMRGRPLGRNTRAKWEKLEDFKRFTFTLAFWNARTEELYWVKYKSFFFEVGFGTAKECMKKINGWKTYWCTFCYGDELQEKKTSKSRTHSVVFGTILPGWFTKRSGKIFDRRQLLENLWFIDINEASRRNLKNIDQCANSYYWQTWGCVTH